MRRDYHIRTSALHQIDTLFSLHHQSVSTLLAPYQLSDESLTSERQTMPVTSFVTLVNQAAAQLHMPDFGMQLGKIQNFEMLGPLGVVLENCHTARDAANVLSALMMFHNQSEYWDFQEYPSATVIQRYDMVGHTLDVRQYRELAVSACFHLCRRLLGQHFHPTAIHFAHAPMAEPQVYEAVFGVPVRFNQDGECIILPADVLNVPIAHYIDALRQEKARYLASLHREYQWDLVQHVSILIQQLLAAQQVSVPHIAQLLGMHPRTFQRQLRREGVNFRELVSAIRLRNAQRYLAASDIDITAISRLLGYQDVANFSRAFYAKEGCYPSQYRLAHRVESRRVK